MLKSARKFNPFLLMGSLMVVVLLMAAACGGSNDEAISNLQKSIDDLAMSQPEGLTAMEVQDIVQKSIDDLAMSQPEGLTATQVQGIVDNAVMSMDSPEGLTAAQAQAIVGSAIAAIQTPEGLTAQQVQAIVANAMSGQPEGLTAMQVQDIVDNALMAAQDPDALTAMKVQEIVSMAISESMMMEEDTTIVFADLNWDSAQIQNGIARYIVEKGYGYETDALFGGTVPLFQGLLVGDIDVTMEIWLPNQNNVWGPAVTAGRVVDVGSSLSDNWQSAFVVPTYVVEQNPGLTTVQSLMEHLGVFEQENGKAILWSCIASWSCSAVNADQVVSYGLSDSLELKDPGSQAGLFASLQGAIDKQEPWLGYMWGPSLPAATHDLTLLEEPDCAPGQAPNDGCAYPIANIKIAVHPSMYDKAPDVVTFLSNWDFTAEADVAANAYKAESGVSFEELAVWFLKTQESTWTLWVPGDVAEKVKAALAQEA